MNGSSIYKGFWCGFQEFIINQGINGLFGGAGWKSYKEAKFPWKKNHNTAFEQALYFHWNFTELKNLCCTWLLGGSVGGQWSSEPGSHLPQVSSCLHLLFRHITSPKADRPEGHHPAARAAKTSGFLAHILNSCALGKGTLEASCNHPKKLIFLNTGEARMASSLITEN